MAAIFEQVRNSTTGALDKAKLVFNKDPGADEEEQQPDRLEELAEYCPQLSFQQVSDKCYDVHRVTINDPRVTEHDERKNVFKLPFGNTHASLTFSSSFYLIFFPPAIDRIRNKLWPRM
jgi:hypothetical protein